MAHQVEWTKIVFDEFLELGMLTQDEQFVMESRIRGYDRQYQADTLGVSVATIDRIIANCKRKYDDVQKISTILPKRRK